MFLKGTATLKASVFDMQALITLQSATNLVKIGYKIRKLQQFENQNSDFF